MASGRRKIVLPKRGLRRSRSPAKPPTAISTHVQGNGKVLRTSQEGLRGDYANGVVSGQWEVVAWAEPRQRRGFALAIPRVGDLLAPLAFEAASAVGFGSGSEPPSGRPARDHFGEPEEGGDVGVLVPSTRAALRVLAVEPGLVGQAAARVACSIGEPMALSQPSRANYVRFRLLGERYCCAETSGWDAGEGGGQLEQSACRSRRRSPCYRAGAGSVDAIERVGVTATRS